MLALARPRAYLVLGVIERLDENYGESLGHFQNAAFYAKDKFTLITIDQ
jgi:hypothetical protein